LEIETKKEVGVRHLQQNYAESMPEIVEKKETVACTDNSPRAVAPSGCGHPCRHQIGLARLQSR